MASIGVSRRALYVTGEESADQIALRAQRLGLVNAAVELLAEVQLEAIVGAIRTQRPDVVVTYEPGGLYGHPDHIKAHEVTIAALDLLEKSLG